ncbi:MAG TPA: hypothetical protein VF530_14035 [Planctomycetota bacterium]
MTSRFGRVSLGWIALAVCGQSITEAQRAAPVELYRLTLPCKPAPPPSGESSSAWAVAGDWAVGFCERPDERGFRWSRATGPTLLLPAPGAVTSWASAVNRTGTTAGVSYPGEVLTLWSAGSGTGTPLSLPYGGAADLRPTALNDAGVLVGHVETFDGFRSWVWDPVNGSRALPSLGFPPSGLATDINALGRISGYIEPSFPVTSPIPFVFDLASGTSTFLATASGGQAFGLDDAGNVVGKAFSLPPGGPSPPCLWRTSTDRLDLTEGSPFAGASGMALDVNEDGLVVGELVPNTLPGQRRAFVWSEALGLRDLNDLVENRGSVLLLTALDVSDRGWIVGIARDTASGTQTMAFLLRPR